MYMVAHKQPSSLLAHCKNVWGASTIVWSSQLHAWPEIGGHFQFNNLDAT